MSEPVRYERVGAAAVLTIDRQDRRNAVDGPTAERCATAYGRFVADDDARVLVLTGAGDVAFCAGADLKAIDTFGPRLDAPGGAARLHPPDAAEADDRRDLRLVPRRRLRARAVVRPADRRRGLDVRLPRAALGRAADRRRHPAPAADRRARARAGPDPHRAAWSSAEEALAMGLVNEVVPPGRHLERALELRRGARRLPAGDDAGRPPRGDRGLRAAARRRRWRSRPGRAGRPSGWPQRRGPVRRRRGSRRSGRRRIAAYRLALHVPVRGRER